MRIKTLMGTIINVDRIKRSITVEGIELGSDCRALVSKHKDGTGTIIRFRIPKLLGTYDEEKVEVNLSYEETLKILNNL